MSIRTKYIVEYAQKHSLKFSRHALNRMKERMIRDYQVYDCIINGSFVEEQYHGEDFKIVFQEKTSSNPEIYIVVAACSTPEVVTVCRTMDEVWGYFENKLKRKKG